MYDTFCQHALQSMNELQDTSWQRTVTGHLPCYMYIDQYIDQLRSYPLQVSAERCCTECCSASAEAWLLVWTYDSILEQRLAAMNQRS